MEWDAIFWIRLSITKRWNVFTGRCASKASLASMNEDWEQELPLSSSPPNRLSPLHTPATTDRGRFRVPDTIQEGRSTGEASKKPGLDLGQFCLHLLLYDRNILPCFIFILNLATYQTTAMYCVCDFNITWCNLLIFLILCSCSPQV